MSASMSTPLQQTTVEDIAATLQCDQCCSTLYAPIFGEARYERQGSINTRRTERLSKKNREWQGRRRTNQRRTAQNCAFVLRRSSVDKVEDTQVYFFNNLESLKDAKIRIEPVSTTIRSKHSMIDAWMIELSMVFKIKKPMTITSKNKYLWRQKKTNKKLLWKSLKKKILLDHFVRTSSTILPTKFTIVRIIRLAPKTVNVIWLEAEFIASLTVLNVIMV